MRQPRDLYAVPEIPVGYPPQLDGAFSVVIPKAAVNLISNPSFELGTVGYSTALGTIAKISTYQRRGVYSGIFTPNTGVDAQLIYSLALVNGTQYSFSLDVLDIPGQRYKLLVNDSVSATLASITWTGNGFWSRYSVIFTANANTPFDLRLIRMAVASVAPIYTDGWQCEVGLPSTYLDGDMIGFIRGQGDFGWTGTPHASSSYRTGQGKAGGCEMNLKTLGLTILSVIGLGLGSVGNISLASVDGGSYFQTSVRKDRQFTIAGQLAGLSPNLPDLQRARRDLQSALDVFNTAKRQPLLLTYQLQDEDGNPISEKVNIRALYNSGLGGQYDNDVGENVGIQFDSFLPLIMSDGEKGASLSYNLTVATPDYVLKRDKAGLWSAVAPGANGAIRCIVAGPDGSIYLGGEFTNLGDANGDYIVKIAPDGTMFSLGTGMNGIVFALAFDAAGNLYAGGSFAAAGGVANTASIAKWNGAAWSALGTGTNGWVQTLVVGPDGILYAGGTFTLAGGVANTARIAKWTGAAWQPLSTGANDQVNAIVVGKEGTIYAGGAFTSMSGVANTAYIAKWNGSAWTPLGTGMGAAVSALLVAPDNSLYTGGVFSTAGGVSASKIARWNGVTWSPLGAGVNSNVNGLFIDQGGLLYVTGSFSSAGSLVVTDGNAIWNGSAWVYLDIDLPGTATGYVVLVTGDSTLYIGYNKPSAGGSSLAPVVTVITNSGTANTYPKFIFTGPGTVYEIRNITTGKIIYFNLILQAGEVATLNLDPNNFSFTSSFRGNIRDTILRGSDTDFYFQHGDNLISVFVAGSTTAATKVTEVYREAYNSLDGTIR